MAPIVDAVTGESEDLVLRFTVWYYADPSKQDEHSKALAKFFTSRLSRTLTRTWTVRPDKKTLPVAYNAEKNKAFTPLEVNFVPCRGFHCIFSS
jgi:hypothetical protein